MTSDTIWATSLLCIALPVLLTFLLRLGSCAAVYLPDSKLAADAASGNKKAITLAALLKNGHMELSVRLFSAVALALVLWATSFLLTGILRQGVLLALLLLLSIVFWTLCVEAPKRIAGYFAEQLAYALTLNLRLWLLVMLPFSAFCRLLIALLLRLLGQNPKQPPHSVTEEEIRMLVDEGEEHGTIEGLERRMINNIFEFGDRDVSEVMTHRTEVSAVAITATLSEIAAVAIETGYSRLPVYDDDIDSICGIIYVKDLLKYMDCQTSGAFSLVKELRNPIYVPESSSCSDVFAIFQRERVQIAVVIDEYGGTYGIVTMEDLLETIFGSIEDEYDNETPQVVVQENGGYLLDGSLGISELEQLLELKIPDDSDADTLGGFLTELLGGVPHNEGDPRSVAFGGVLFEVVACDERKITRVLTKNQPQPFE